MRDRFRAAGMDSPERDARLLAEVAFDLKSLALVTHERDPAPEDGLNRLGRFSLRRLGGEPVARILGHKEFWGLDFALNDATLVPRPETEMLVERGIEELAAIEIPAILDLGTGTGCIPISLLVERPDALATAVDVSSEALAMTMQNARTHGVGGRMTLLEGSWFVPLAPEAAFDLVTANPPYIETATLETLAREVREHDPVLALDGGADGLDAFRAIVGEAGPHLRPGGTLLLEIGSGQGPAVRDLLRQAGFSDAEIVRDLAGHDRMAVGKRR